MLINGNSDENIVAQKPPISSWNTHLKEHRGVPGGIIVHLGGENLELSFLLGASGMCC